MSRKAFARGNQDHFGTSLASRSAVVRITTPQRSGQPAFLTPDDEQVNSKEQRIGAKNRTL